MKKLLLLLLLPVLLKAQITSLTLGTAPIAEDTTTNIYVDRDASGAGDGTSWADAYTSLSDVVWTGVGDDANDTVYVSGGADSTSYDRWYLEDLSFTNYVVIAEGKDSGHDGDVYFTTSSIVSDYCFGVDNCDNIKFVGFTLTNDLDLTSYVGQIFESGNYCNNIWLDSVHVITPGNAIGIGGDRNTGFKLTNSTVETLTNDVELGQDPVVMGLGSEYTFHGNTFIYRQLGGVDGTGNHGDMVQLAQSGTYGYGESVISNNIFYMNVPNDAVDMNCMLYIADQKQQGWTLRNNLFVHSGHDSTEYTGMINFVRTSGAYEMNVRLYNNTFIEAKAPPGDYGTANVLLVRAVDSLVMKNNLFYMDNYFGQYESHFGSVVSRIQDMAYVDIDYNWYYDTDGASNLYDGGMKTWSAWQALGYDTNGDTATVSFASVFDSVTTALSHKLVTGSGGLSAGTDLSSLFTDDLLGTTRSDWDVGALEGEAE